MPDNSSNGFGVRDASVSWTISYPRPNAVRG